MLLTLPVYVELRREDGQPVHHCWPVFLPGVRAADPHLGLAMSKLHKRLKQLLDRLGSSARHDELAAHAFAPDLETHVLKLTLDLRDRREKYKLLFVEFSALGRRIAFSPVLPELWMEIVGSQKLEERAAEVLTYHFRRHEKVARKSGANPLTMSSPQGGQMWVTSVDVDVKTQASEPQDLQKTLAALFADSRMDGGVELQRVGRCLDWLYPDELQQAVAREREVHQLDRLLADPGNRPIALIGPRLAGKTVVLHECVRRRVGRRKKPYSTRQNVWLLSPQRLISGMMYLGQWEGRLQAILREVRKRRHVLYFDDFLGLYQAGISRDASHCVADILKPFVLRRDVRVLAELTPEAWQAFQERDRGLADQFHVLRVAATSEVDTQRVMLEVHRQLEAQHRCRFEWSALPTMMQLHQSYIRDAAFPGKTAAFSRRLAKKRAKLSVSREDVNDEFHLQTGLARALLDDRVRLERDTLIRQLRTRVIGQDEAVEAAADVVQVAKARLADPARPLATLLFLGPTGVGKTQCAKALAEVMFSDPGRLIRLDMNEYGSPQAVTQLVGTFGDPEGLLTSAVRRQPFSVLLLDEIEKAHPDVFDLLLQVTGEGRLTDALGRTADFSNIVIVLTSNLGTTAGRGPLGLAEDVSTARNSYVKAAEGFFRPEFFNRIDRVIPFEKLSRDQMRQIAELLLADVFQRDGLVRRRCALAVADGAMERIVDAGYHPQFGARALKRAIERQLIQPVAASLARVKPELPAVIGVYPHPEGVTAAVHTLESVATVDGSWLAEQEPAQQLARMRQFLDRVEADIDSARPSSLAQGHGISAAQLRYYALKEQWHRCREIADQLREAESNVRRGARRPGFSPKTPAEKMIIRSKFRTVPTQRFLRDIQAAHDIHEYLQETSAAVPRPEEFQQRLAALRNEAAFLQLLLSSAEMPGRALLLFHALIPSERRDLGLSQSLKNVFEWFGYGCEIHVPDLTSRDPLQKGGPSGLLVTGPGAWPLAATETGVHVFCRRHENLLPVQVSLVPASDVDVTQQVEAQWERRRLWLADLARGQADVGSDPWPVGAILRFYDDGGATLDLRTGRSLSHMPSTDEWRELIMAGLPPPEDL